MSSTTNNMYLLTQIANALVAEAYTNANSNANAIELIATDKTIKPIVYSEIARLGIHADLNHIDVSQVTNMADLFLCNEFDGDISKWNTSNVENMKGMFEESQFNGDISGWDVSNVKTMESMFAHSQFNGNISEWAVSKVESMHAMFSRSKFNGDISNWNVSNVKDMIWMFHRSEFNGNISEWDVSNVELMDEMFIFSKFNGDISKWNVRDDCRMGNALFQSPSKIHPSFGKLHFMTKADNDFALVHPDAEAAYTAFMPIAKATHPNESRWVQGAKAWEAYQASRA